MQVNSINNNNFNGMSIPPQIKTELERDLAKLLKHDPNKMGNVAQLISIIQHDRPNIDLVVAAKQGLYNPKTAEDFDVFVANKLDNTQTNISGNSLAAKFLAGILYITGRA